MLFLYMSIDLSANILPGIAKNLSEAVFLFWKQNNAEIMVMRRDEAGWVWETL